jgi:hypothetical protein
MSRYVALAMVLFTGASLIACGQLGGTATDSSSPSPTGASPSASASASTPPPISFEIADAAGSSPRNIVQAQSHQDGQLQIRGRIQLNAIKGDTVSPLNLAFAFGDHCTDCKTLAVALQLNVTPKTAHVVTPQNFAVAVNAGCTRCITIARALQYNVPVDDPTQIPADARRLVQEMRQQLTDVSTSKDIDIVTAEARVNLVIGEFRELALSLNDKRDEKTDTDSPTPSPGLIPSASPASGSPALQPSASPSAAPTASP